MARKLLHREDQAAEEVAARQQRIWTDPVTYTLTTASELGIKPGHPS
jgi:hypothetical protein